MTLSALLKILSFSSPSPPSNYLVWTSNYWITRLCRALVLAVTLWETPSKEDTRFETVFNCRCRSFTPKTQDQYKMHVKSVQYSAHKGCGFGELEKSQRMKAVVLRSRALLCLPHSLRDTAGTGLRERGRWLNAGLWSSSRSQNRWGLP